MANLIFDKAQIETAIDKIVEYMGPMVLFHAMIQRRGPATKTIPAAGLATVTMGPAELGLVGSPCSWGTASTTLRRALPAMKAFLTSPKSKVEIG